MDLVTALPLDFTKGCNDQITGKAPGIVLVTQANFIGLTQGSTAHHQVGQLIERGDRPMQTQFQTQSGVIALDQGLSENASVLFFCDSIFGVLQLGRRDAIVPGYFLRIETKAGEKIQQPDQVAGIGIDLFPSGIMS